MFDALASLALVLVPIAGLATQAIVESEESHCVVLVVDMKPDGELVTTDSVCFPDKALAEAWANVGLASVPLSTRTPGLDSAVPLSSFTLGTHYDGANGSGSSISVVGSSCTGGYWNTPTAWDNRISSSYNGCARLQHWDLPGKQGASQNTTGAGTTDNLTTMNNRAESVSYHSS